MPKKRKKKIAAPVKGQRGLELKYQRELGKFGRAMAKSVKEELLPYLKSSQESYVMDGIGDQLSVIFRRLNSAFTGNIAAGFAKNTASQMVERVGKVNQTKFNRSINRATGVNLGSIVTAEGLDDFMALSVNKNVSLIKSLPEEYFKQIETIVNNGVVNGARYSTIAKEITAKTGSANSKLVNRIKTIARNEVQTINAQITLRRSDKLGITRGIYRTSEDERVRPCHKELNGVEYELKKGAWSKSCGRYIQPGITDINCRCSYSPVIDLDEPGKTKASKKQVVKPVKKSVKTPTNKEVSPLKKHKSLVSANQKSIEKAIGKSSIVAPAELNNYIKDSDINASIRNDGVKSLSSEEKEQMIVLDGILNQTQIKEPVQLNRGLSFRDSEDFDSFLQNMKVGTIQQDDAYVSTTTANISDDFQLDKHNVKIKILADEDTKGLYVSNLEGISKVGEKENEFLMPRKTKMEVVSKPKIKGKTAEIVLKVVNI